MTVATAANSSQVPLCYYKQLTSRGDFQSKIVHHSPLLAVWLFTTSHLLADPNQSRTKKKTKTNGVTLIYLSILFIHWDSAH